MNRQTSSANTTAKTLSITTLLLALLLAPVWLLAQTDNHRLIILADMGNEPDEVQQMVHMMMYSNEFDLEGLIAVTGKYLNPQQKEPYRRVLHPELFTGIIDAYGEVVENLRKHATDWPEVDYLHSIVATGQPEYGIAGTGEGKSTPGSELIVNSFLKDDDRPIYIVINAGSNTLAQALIDFRAEHSQRELDAVIPKLRVFENGAQDNAGAWICSKFPDIHWIRSNYQTYCYGGPMPETAEKLQLKGLKQGPYTWQPYAYSDIGQHQWTLEHVISHHGALGAYYPLRMMANKLFFLEGGGTIPWLGLIHRGLSNIDQPGWGGWSGRFTREKVPNVWSRHKDVQQDEENYGEFKLYTEVADHWVDPATDSVYDHVFAPVYRWRQAFFNDFQCRMDWCVEDFEDANHNPVAAINGDQAEKIHIIRTEAGKTVQLDASASSDPDGDQIQYNWWIYQEAGTYPSPITLTDANQPVVSLPIPEDSNGQEIHLILEITDKNEIASLHDYRRVVFEVE
ncbi:MAG: nucleoside hydrolase-like domain-containing protein [Bacteroidota bacterium]